MHRNFLHLIKIITILLAVSAGVFSQGLTRDLGLATGGNVVVVNHYGRVAAKSSGTVGDGPSIAGKMIASSDKGVVEADIKYSAAGGKVFITVVPKDPQKRIDILLNLPERAQLKVETTTGAVDVGGDFARVDVETETGTITTDVPTDNLTFDFEWTESRPRFLSDVELPAVKEKAAGRFEIKGRIGFGEKRKKENEIKADPLENGATEIVKPKVPGVGTGPLELNFQTARGIILLNVEPREVGSDLRERPLTNAAKAIVRSGDSLLMEAIRRASPKYFGDYTRTLPPIKLEPRFAKRDEPLDTQDSTLKRAVVRVTDLNNRAVPDLSASDFEISEGSVQREIISVEPSTAPFNLVLLLDVSGSVENYVNFIRKAARSFVETVNERDKVSIVIFNDDVKVLSKFTTDKGKLSESLDTFDAGGGTAYYDALAYTVADTLRPLKGERTAIVILTDGDDNRSFLAFDSLTGSIQESGALIYPLYVPSGLIALAAQGVTADIDPMRKKYMALSAKSSGEGERLAKVSGGVYYPITQIGQIQTAYTDIVLQLRTAYNVTFRSSTDKVQGSGVSPRLKIKAKKPNTFTNITSIESMK